MRKSEVRNPEGRKEMLRWTFLLEAFRRLMVNVTRCLFLPASLLRPPLLDSAPFDPFSFSFSYYPIPQVTIIASRVVAIAIAIGSICRYEPLVSQTDCWFVCCEDSEIRPTQFVMIINRLILSKFRDDLCKELLVRVRRGGGELRSCSRIREFECG